MPLMFTFDGRQPPRSSVAVALAAVVALASCAICPGQTRVDGTVQTAETPSTPATSRPASPTQAAAGCELHGTCVSWAPNLETAQNMAREQAKLLFVVHLSGNFAKPTFT